jgi:heme oxygenase
VPPNAGINSGSFHSLLRQETDSRHRALENTALSARLLSPLVTLQDYLFYLRAFSGIARWYDSQVLPLVTDTLDDTAERRKLPLIFSDLEELENIGYPAPSYPAFEARDPRDKAEALGACYVLEGSSLGGRVILKHIRPILPPALPRGAAFFTGYGEATASKWKYFLEKLEDFAALHPPDPIIRGAVSAFDLIKAHFTKYEATAAVQGYRQP